MSVKYITMAEASQIVPGTPSSCTLWRWCRRGIKSRTGKLVRLQHVRMGGSIYTTEQWINDFGKELARADDAYFTRDDE